MGRYSSGPNSLKAGAWSTKLKGHFYFVKKKHSSTLLNDLNDLFNFQGEGPGKGGFFPFFYCL
jgi:hypothetical protein